MLSELTTLIAVTALATGCTPDREFVYWSDHKLVWQIDGETKQVSAPYVRDAQSRTGTQIYFITSSDGSAKLHSVFYGNVRDIYKGDPPHHSFDIENHYFVLLLERYLHKDSRVVTNSEEIRDDYIYREIDKKTWSTVDNIEQFKKVGIGFPRPNSNADGRDGDWTHTNFIQRIKYRNADPRFDVNNYLVSFRNLDLIAIIDSDLESLIWTMRGPFCRQHSPVMGEDGFIYVFDNGNCPERDGRNRVLKIDPSNKNVKVLLELDASKSTKVGGLIQYLGPEHLLVSVRNCGRVLEIEGSEIVWEFLNPILKWDDDKPTSPCSLAYPFRIRGKFARRSGIGMRFIKEMPRFGRQRSG